MALPVRSYQLILHAIGSSDAALLTRLRAVLVGDLELPVEEAKKVLAGGKKILKTSNSQTELEPFLVTLKSIGVEAGIQEINSGLDSVNPVLDLTASTQPSQSKADTTTQDLDLLSDLPAASQESEGLDSMEQISDIFRDLESACVIGSGKEVLEDLPKASPTAPSTTPAIAHKGKARKPVPTLLQRRFWERAISIPEMLFSIGFSLLLALVTAILYTR
jgi:hypothetical protein